MIREHQLQTVSPGQLSVVHPGQLAVAPGVVPGGVAPMLDIGNIIGTIMPLIMLMMVFMMIMPMFRGLAEAFREGR